MYDLTFALLSDLRDSAWNRQPLARRYNFCEATSWSILVQISCEILQERNEVTPYPLSLSLHATCATTDPV